MIHTNPTYRKIAAIEKVIPKVLVAGALAGATLLGAFFGNDVIKTYQNAGDYRGAKEYILKFPGELGLPYGKSVPADRALTIFEAAREEYNCRMAEKICVPPETNFQPVTLDNEPHEPADELEGTLVEGVRGTKDYTQEYESVGVIYGTDGTVTVKTREGEIRGGKGQHLGDLVRRCVSHRHPFTQ